MSEEESITDIQKLKTSKLYIASIVCVILCALSPVVGIMIVPLMVLPYYLTGKIPGAWFQSLFEFIERSGGKFIPLLFYFLGPLLFGMASIILYYVSVTISKLSKNK